MSGECRGDGWKARTELFAVEEVQTLPRSDNQHFVLIGKQGDHLFRAKGLGMRNEPNSFAVKVRKAFDVVKIDAMIDDTRAGDAIAINLGYSSLVIAEDEPIPLEINLVV